MKAVVFENYGDADVLKLQEHPMPKIKPNEVLIKVKAAGINRADIAQRKGNYPAPKGCVQNILGLEVSGKIEEIGDQVEHLNIKDKTCALLPGGGYAEYVAVDAGSCLPIPKNFSLEDAAALPEVLLTVWQNIFQIGQLKKDENVLVYGGSGGVGSMAIQLVNLYEANAWTVASNDEKTQFCQSLGAQKVVNYTTQDLVEEFGKRTVHLILDSVGGKYLDVNINLLKPEGRMVYINAMHGNAKLNIFKMMQKRLHITGSTLRARSNDHKQQLVNEVVEKAYPLIEQKDFKHTISKRFPFEEAAQAHKLMESRDFSGKLVLCF